MVDADDAQWQIRVGDRKLGWHSRLVERGGDVVDWHRVVRISPSTESDQPVEILVVDDNPETYVSALTSHTTESVRFGEESVCSLTKGGIFAER